MNNNDSHQSNVNFPVLPKEIWFKILEICEFDSLYSMYWVNKLFQQIMKNMNLLPLWTCVVSDSSTCKTNRENIKKFTNYFLRHHKLLKRIKNHIVEFRKYPELDKLFKNSQLSPMINMLEIDFKYDDWSMLESVRYFPNITMLSLLNTPIISKDFLEICSKNSFLRYLNLCCGELPLSMDFSTCSFVNFSLNNMNCEDETSIKMPCCLKKCYLKFDLREVDLLPNSSIEFQMSHCKELNTL
jgi:hypothetical protein